MARKTKKDKYKGLERKEVWLKPEVVKEAQRQADEYNPRVQLKPYLESLLENAIMGKEQLSH